MSIKITADVWGRSRATGTTLLVAVALADHGDSESREAFPSQEYLAAKCRVSPSTVKRAVAKLVALGEIKVRQETTHRGRRNIYTFTPAEGWGQYDLMGGGVTRDLTGGVTAMTREPSVEPSLPPSPNGSGGASTASKELRDGVWDALTAVCGQPATTPEKSRRGKVVKGLLSVGAQPDEVRACAEWCSRQFRDVVWHDTAVLSNWSTWKAEAAASVPLSQRMREEREANERGT